MLTPTLDPTRKTPIYEQLYRYLREEIETHRLPENHRLPSKRKFASHIKVSQGTIEAAYSQLMAEGYIYSREKRGYYVCHLEGNVSLQQPRPAASPAALQPSPNPCRFILSTARVDTENFPFATWAKLMREILNGDRDSLLGPVDPQGDADLRAGIVRYLHDFRGIDAEPGQVVLGAGSEFLLGLITQLLPRQYSYAYEDPGYRKTERILAANGLPALAVPLDRYGMDISALEACGANVAHVTPSHHFPLGIITPIGRRQELLAWASHGERYIIEDDYDSEFRFSGRPIPALKSLDNNERVIYMNTFAKTLAPSLRISYMVLPPHLIQKYRKDLFFYSCTIPSFEQRTLALFLNRGHFERHLSRMRKIYRTRRDAFVDGFHEHWEQITLTGLEAGPHLLLTVRNGMREQELVTAASQKNIQIFPLSAYYASRSAPPATIVAGYSGYSAEVLRDIAQSLCAVWF